MPHFTPFAAIKRKEVVTSQEPEQNVMDLRASNIIITSRSPCIFNERQFEFHPKSMQQEIAEPFL